MKKTADEMSNIELCWDQFDDWCIENEIDEDDEGNRDTIWWDCWSTAVIAKIEAEAAEEAELGLPKKLMSKE